MKRAKQKKLLYQKLTRYRYYVGVLVILLIMFLILGAYAAIDAYEIAYPFASSVNHSPNENIILVAIGKNGFDRKNFHVKPLEKFVFRVLRDDSICTTLRNEDMGYTLNLAERANEFPLKLPEGKYVFSCIDKPEWKLEAISQ